MILLFCQVDPHGIPFDFTIPAGEVNNGGRRRVSAKSAKSYVDAPRGTGYNTSTETPKGGATLKRHTFYAWATVICFFLTMITAYKKV